MKKTSWAQRCCSPSGHGLVLFALFAGMAESERACIREKSPEARRGAGGHGVRNPRKVTCLRVSKPSRS
ncbi:hypothetical protein FH608_038690 [Nonomuraea phyllanthi]|uniref:Uncharacterized protein n=1 Tax=Nonomuraea phyllanthi TaxID=2219224 RepID=A0A5C4VMW7_9ACTN|nr:hypothetical protein FH608_038690 [Nonomuraea phyllanthi]